MAKYIVIAGNFEFPDGNAAGKRVAGFGKIIEHLGYTPVFIGVTRKTVSQNILESKQLYGNAVSYKTPYSRSVKQYLTLGKKVKLFFDVVQDLGSQNVHGVILYRSITLSLWMSFIIRWCKKNSKPVLVDCSDWMPLSCESFLRHIVKVLDVNYQNNIVTRQADGIIVVSSFIENFFKRKNCKTVMLPHVFNRHELDKYRQKFPYHPCECRRFIYTGIPFQIGTKTSRSMFKDRIDRSLELFHRLYRNGYSFRFDIYGFTESDYLFTVPEHENIIREMKDVICFHGMCGSDEIIKQILLSDFMILNRDDILMTRAGFPTKVAESMALGTPVITEPTSNIADYLSHGDNGFLFEKGKEYEVLEYAMQLSEDEVLKLHKNCVDDPKFDYTRFVGVLAEALKI